MLLSGSVPSRRQALAFGIATAASLCASVAATQDVLADESDAPATSGMNGPRVTVNGTCTIAADPDTADITMGVVAEASDAVACQNEAADLVDATLAALDAAGIDSDHVTTQGLNLYPQYDYSSNTPVVIGYRVDVSLNVIGVPIDRVGEIVSVATQAGVNQVYGIQYYTSSFDEMYREALIGALSAARTKAEAMAAHEGFAIDGVLDMAEGYENRIYRSAGLSNIDVMAEEAAMDGAASAKSIAIDPGTVEIVANVTVTYSLKAA